MSTKTNSNVKRCEDCDEKNDNSENSQQPQIRKISCHLSDLVTNDFSELLTTVTKPKETPTPAPLIVDKNKWQQKYNNNFNGGQETSYCQNNHMNCHHPVEEDHCNGANGGKHSMSDVSLYVDSEDMNNTFGRKVLVNGGESKICDFVVNGERPAERRNVEFADVRVNVGIEDHNSSGNETDDVSHSSHTDEADRELVDNGIIIPGGNYPSDYEDNDYDEDYDDEEISLNSDDCVYEYRGGNAIVDLEMALVERVVAVDDGQDEETDFLEMDFDPDPSSEIDGYANENAPEFFVAAAARNDHHNPIAGNHSPNGAISAAVLAASDDNLGVDQVLPTHSRYSDNDNDGQDIERYTGAKPKKFSKKIEHKPIRNGNGDMLEERLSSNGRNDVTNKRSLLSLYSTYDSYEDHCIDCAERDFLSKTVPGQSGKFKVCKTCTNTDGRLVKNEQRPDSLRLIPKIDAGPSNWRDCTDAHDVLAATFSSINCDENVIIHALESLKLTPDRDIIRLHFRADIEADTSQLDVPDYIMHISKQNCHYKKLIGLIRRLYPCTNLDIDFFPLITTGRHACSQSLHFLKNETNPVSSTEIMKRWNANTDMSRLARVRNKQFHNQNILGKVVNVIRSTHHRLHSRNAPESIINIPHYYPSGYISITKKDYIN